MNVARNPSTGPTTALGEAIAAATADLHPSVPAAGLERPPRPEFGDYSTNAAMLAAPLIGEPPRDVAAKLTAGVEERLGESVERVEVAGPGFLNLHMSEAWFRDAAALIADRGRRFGSAVVDRPSSVLVEFVSANPTGPLTVASGRHLAYGHSLARVLEFAGHSVRREYYLNDWAARSSSSAPRSRPGSPAPRSPPAVTRATTSPISAPASSPSTAPGSVPRTSGRSASS